MPPSLIVAMQTNSVGESGWSLDRFADPWICCRTITRKRRFMVPIISVIF
jgi:hypothetical protein